MTKKIYYSLTLIISIGMCLALICFPILKYNRESVNKNCKVLVNTYLENGYSLDEAIDKTIDNISTTLKIYGDESSIMSSGVIDDSLLEMSLTKLKNQGIKYIDLVSGLKNQFSTNKSIKDIINDDSSLSKKEKLEAIKVATYNPLVFILIVIFFAMVFSASFILAIRSIKGISGKKRPKVFIISLFGLLISAFLIFLPNLFVKEITEVDALKDYVKLFMYSVKGSDLCFYYFFGFLICLVFSIVAKFAKNERKI